MEHDETSPQPPAATQPPPTAPPPATPAASMNAGVVTELAGYFGLALAVSGYSLVVGGTDLMESSWGAVLFMAVLTAGLLFAGMMIRSDEDAPAKRLCDVMWALSAFTAAVTIAGVAGNLMGTTDDIRPMLLLVSLVSAAYAGVLWALRRRTLPLVVFWLFSLLVVGVIGAYIGLDEFVFPALLMWAFGLVVIFLGRSGVLSPKRPALVLGAILVGFVPFFFGSPMIIGIIVGLLSTALLFSLGDMEKHAGVTGIAIVGAFIYTSQIVTEYGSDSTGIQIGMLVVGLLLLGYALMTMRKT